MTEPRLVPRAPNEWKDDAVKDIPEDVVANGVPTRQFSASKTTFEDFLLLRVLWPKLESGDELYNSGIIPSDYLQKAINYLAARTDWRRYLDAIQQKPRPARPEIGTFSNAYYLQAQVNAIPEEASPEREATKTVWSPVSKRTRGNIREREMANSVTPTRGPRAGPHHVNLSDLFGQMELSGESQERNPLASPQSSTTSQSPVQSPKHSPDSPLRALETDSPGDEATVNAALVALLSSLTAYHPEVKADWIHDRRQFRLLNVMTARTDGILGHRILKHGGKKETRAILEVKPSLRRYLNVRLQETSQMVSWIAQESETGELPRVSDVKKRRRIIISQDHTEIYITCAEYDNDYVEFLRKFGERKGSNLLSTNGPFMRMREFGPFNTWNAKNMEQLGAIILGLTIMQN